MGVKTHLLESGKTHCWKFTTVSQQFEYLRSVMSTQVNSAHFNTHPSTFSHSYGGYPSYRRARGRVHENHVQVYHRVHFNI